MGLNGLFLLGTAEDHALAESVRIIGTTDVSHIFHAEHGELEVVLSFSEDEGVNSTGVVAPSVHLAHGGNALVVEVEEAPLVKRMGFPSVNVSIHINRVVSIFLMVCPW